MADFASRGLHGLGLNVRPAAAERVAGNLRHGEELQHVEIEAVEAPRREVGDDVVVEDRREERAAKELREGHVRLAQRRDSGVDQSPASTSKKPALVSSVIDRNSGNRK